ncbi:MAG: SRPBCC family protein [Acidimicrobiales bacterium]
MIRAQGSIVIDRSAEEVLTYVLDLDRYRQADAKIAKVLLDMEIGPDQLEGRQRFRGSLRGLPTPAQTQIVKLEPWRSLRIQSDPNDWTTKLATFSGGFICEPMSTEAVELTHYEQFAFRGPLAWIMDPMLRGWMQRYLIETELPALKRLIESTKRVL